MKCEGSVQTQCQCTEEVEHPRTVVPVGGPGTILLQTLKDLLFGLPTCLSFHKCFMSAASEMMSSWHTVQPFAVSLLVAKLRPLRVPYRSRDLEFSAPSSPQPGSI